MDPRMGRGQSVPELAPRAQRLGYLKAEVLGDTPSNLAMRDVWEPRSHRFVERTQREKRSRQDTEGTARALGRRSQAQMHLRKSDEKTPRRDGGMVRLRNLIIRLPRISEEPA